MRAGSTDAQASLLDEPMADVDTALAPVPAAAAAASDAGAAGELGKVPTCLPATDDASPPNAACCAAGGG
eukprot:7244998-Lingulodinium_polyedra.AAC.1